MPKTIKWRSSRSLRGVQAQLQKHMNLCHDGASVWIDYGLASTLLEVIEQAKRTEIEGEGLDREH